MSAEAARRAASGCLWTGIKPALQTCGALFHHMSGCWNDKGIAGTDKTGSLTG